MVVAAPLRRLQGQLHGTGTWMLLGGACGFASAIATLVFLLASESLSLLLLTQAAGVHLAHPAGEPLLMASPRVVEHGPRWWVLLPVLFVVGALAGKLASTMFPGNHLGDTDTVVDAYHRRRGFIPTLRWVGMFVAAILTKAGGGSVGNEGPTVLAGGALGGLLGDRMRQGSRRRRQMLVAGAAGGIAAAFHAPLAGALYAGEMLYSESDLDADTLIPALIAAITGYCSFGLMAPLAFASHGAPALFSIPTAPVFGAQDAPQLVGYALIALAGALGAWMLRQALARVRVWWRPLQGRPWLAAGLGAMACGVVAWSAWSMSVLLGVPAGDGAGLATLGSGYGILQRVFDAAAGLGALSHMDVYGLAILLCLLGLAKVVATALTLGSGCSGGVFAPSLVIGGCLGGTIGLLLDGWAIAPPLSACVVMGMAGILTANFRTPLAALLMVCELTGNYRLLLPAMWVAAIAFIVSGRRGLLSAQVPTALDSPAHQGHFFTDVLATIPVSAVFQPDTNMRSLHANSSLDECRAAVAETVQTLYPLVDDHQHLVGYFSMDDLRQFLFDDTLGLVAVAADIATSEVAWVTPQDTLAGVLRRLTERNLDAIPVVQSPTERRLLGLLERRVVVAHYNRVVEQLRTSRREEGWEEASAVRGATRPVT